jgi:hypothetical protein
MSTISISPTGATGATGATNATGGRSRTLRGRLGAVPWLTVMPLAVVLAYADGFWMISLRGAVGAIERTQEPFATWLRESTLTLPIFVLAVLGALTLAAHWFGPVLRRPKAVAVAALLVVAATTLVGIAALAASAAYDYHLQSAQLLLMDSTHSTGAMAGMTSMGSSAQQQHASLGLQVRAVSFGSGLVLLTNLVLVGWMVAMNGGRLKASTTQP